VAIAPGEFNSLDSLGQVLFTRGLLDRSLETYQKARSLNPRVGEDLPIAYILALREDYDGAIASLDQYIASVSSEARRSEGFALRGILFHLLGRRVAALRELDQGRALARSAGAALRESVILTARGFLLTDTGDIRRALDETASAVRVADALRDAGGRLVTRVAKYLAEIRAGDFNAAAATMAELDRESPPPSRSPFIAAAFRSVEVERLIALGDDEGAIRLGDAPQRYEILPGTGFSLFNLPWRGSSTSCVRCSS
jgi:tetratricopeptide (TPR) repeat protein